MGLENGNLLVIIKHNFCFLPLFKLNNSHFNFSLKRKKLELNFQYHICLIINIFFKEFAVGEDYNKITLIKQYLGKR